MIVKTEGMTGTESAEPTDSGAGRGGAGLAAARPLIRQMAMIGAGLAAWWLVYGQLASLAEWATYGVLGIERGGHLGDAVEFFLYDTPKVLMLLTLVVFGAGDSRRGISLQRAAGHWSRLGGGRASMSAKRWSTA
jgi:hypothetical protein